MVATVDRARKIAADIAIYDVAGLVPDSGAPAQGSRWSCCINPVAGAGHADV